jgi:hypothetical protein
MANINNIQNVWKCELGYSDGRKKYKYGENAWKEDLYFEFLTRRY